MKGIQHALDNHMIPVKNGNSYFLSCDKTYVSSLIIKAKEEPDKILPHNIDKWKGVHKKKFPNMIGIHGYSRKPCYNVTVIINNTNQEIITAYPTV